MFFLKYPCDLGEPSPSQILRHVFGYDRDRIPNILGLRRFEKSVKSRSVITHGHNAALPVFDLVGYFAPSVVDVLDQIREHRRQPAARPFAIGYAGSSFDIELAEA